MITESSPEILKESLDKVIELKITLEDSQTLPQALMILLEHPKPYRHLKNHHNELKYLRQLLKTVTEGFDGPNNSAIAYQLHKSLNTIYDYQINSFAKSSQYDPILMEVMLELEDAWITFEKTRVPREEIPTNAKEFTKWIKSYALKHPSSQHRIFKYLADDCTREEMTYFFSQEVTIDPRFDDLIALMQVGIDKLEVKLELAGNFWDEMGNGKLEEVHTKLFSNLYDEIDVFKDGENFLDVLDRASWQALACGNTLLYSVLHRKNLNIGLGALGTVEIISPYRFSHLTRGFKRLGLSDRASVYHRTHIEIDARHGNGWLNNAIKPIVTETPEARKEIFFGSMLRMNTSADYCEHIEQQFKKQNDLK